MLMVEKTTNSDKIGRVTNDVVVKKVANSSTSWKAAKINSSKQTASDGSVKKCLTLVVWVEKRSTMAAVKEWPTIVYFEVSLRAENDGTAQKTTNCNGVAWIKSNHSHYWYKFKSSQWC